MRTIPHTAYVCVFIDADGQMTKIGVFSDPSPTRIERGMYVRLAGLQVEALTYREAAEQLLKLAHSFEPVRTWFEKFAALDQKPLPRLRLPIAGD